MIPCLETWQLWVQIIYFLSGVGEPLSPLQPFLEKKVGDRSKGIQKSRKASWMGSMTPPFLRQREICSHSKSIYYWSSLTYSRLTGEAEIQTENCRADTSEPSLILFSWNQTPFASDPFIHQIAVKIHSNSFQMVLAIMFLLSRRPAGQHSVDGITRANISFLLLELPYISLNMCSYQSAQTLNQFSSSKASAASSL